VWNVTYCLRRKSSRLRAGLVFPIFEHEEREEEDVYFGGARQSSQGVDRFSGKLEFLMCHGCVYFESSIIVGAVPCFLQLNEVRSDRLQVRRRSCAEQITQRLVKFLLGEASAYLLHLGVIEPALDAVIYRARDIWCDKTNSFLVDLVKERVVRRRD